MQNLFEHTVQPLGSTTSPVEDLALEVTDAFEKIEEIVETDPKMIKSFRDAIGSPIFNSLKSHLTTKKVTESHNILERESNIVLENIPDVDSLSIFYVSQTTGDVVNLIKVDNNSDFTNKNEYKLDGKVILLNVDIPSNKSTVFTVVYQTTTFGLNNKKLIPNVIKDLNGSWTFRPEFLGDDKFRITLQVNLSDKLDEYKLNQNETLTFFSTENVKDWKKVEVAEYTINGSIINFTASDLTLTRDTKVSLYLNNTTISDLLDSLYKEFIDHDHSNSNITTNIDIKDVINKTVNSGKISYKANNIPNYSFPQYFNREGYNPNIDSVYENSILGNIFLARVLSNDGLKFKGLDNDSNKLIFGDPDLGHTINYEYSSDSLKLTSNSLSNGLNITTKDAGKYSLKLNNSKFYSATTSLKITPQNNILEVVSSDSALKSNTKVEDFTVLNHANINSASVKNFNINKVQFIENVDKFSVDVNGIDSDTAALNINVPTNIKSATISDLTILNAVNQNNANISALKIGNVTYKKDADNNVSVESTVTNAYVKYNVQLKANVVNPATIKIGDILIDSNDDDNNKGILIWTSDPNSNVQITANTKIKNLDVESVHADALSATSAAIDDLNVTKSVIGGVSFNKTNDDNLSIDQEKADKKIIVNTPVEFKNVTTGIDSKVILTTVSSETLTVGNHKIKKEDNDTIITPVIENDITSLFKIDSKTEIADASVNKLTSKNTDIDKLRIGGSVISNVSGVTTITPDSASESLLDIKTKTEIDIASIENLTSADLHSDSADVDELTIGGIIFKENATKDLIIENQIADKTIQVKAKTIFDNVSIAKTEITNSNIVSSTANLLKFGNIAFQKELGTTNAAITRIDGESLLKVEAPTEIKELSVDKLIVKADTNLANTSVESLKLGGHIFKTSSDNSTMDVTEANDKPFNFKTPLLISKGSAETLSSKIYTIYNKDKLGVNSENYFSNEDGKFVFVHKKNLNFVGSGKDTGLAFSHSLTSLPVLRQYISANSGAGAVDTEKNIFFESDVTSGVYFLKPTNQRISLNNTIFGFNDSTADKNISDLTKWFRTDIYTGNIEATSLNVSVNETGKRNGISIGSTRLSVVGPESNCPDGLTVLESLDGIHMVQPMAPNSDGCNNLTYQELSVGSTNIKGDISIDGSGTLTEDLLVNGTIAGNNLVSTSESELNNVIISGNATIAGDAIFGSSVTFKNDITLSNNLTSNSKISAKSLEVELNSLFGKSLDIGQDLNVAADVAIGGGLTVKQGFISDGVIKSVGVDTDKISTGDLSVSGDGLISGKLAVQGKLIGNSGMTLSGPLESSSSISVKESLTTNTLFTVKDATIRGKFTAMDSADIFGNNINLGTEETFIQVNGKIQFNTKNDIIYNSPVRLYDTLRVIGETEVVGKFKNVGGADIDSYLNVNGKLVATSDAIFESNTTLKTATVMGNLDVGNSIISDNITSESIIIKNTATMENLTITGSLSMAVDTTVVAGQARFTGLSLTDSEAKNNISGELVVSKDTNLIRNVFIGQKLIFGTDSVILNSEGIQAKDGTVSAKTIKASEFQGVGKVQTPAALLTSRNSVVNQIAASIPSRQFVKIDNFVSDGICLFTNPLVADTILFKDLIYVGDDVDAASGFLGLDIIARKAVYG